MHFGYALGAADSRALGAFSLIHSSPANATQVTRYSDGHAVPIVMYTESVPICGGNGGVDVPHVTRCNDTVNFETGGFRRDAMVYFAGNLTRPLSAAGTELELCLGVPNCCNKYAAPLVASTANGSYSDYSGSAYVTFVRIGDELLKVVAAHTKPNPDPEVGGMCQRLTVERGLDGSAIKSAPVGAAVLAPVYAKQNGSPLFTKSGKMVFQADYDSFYAWSSLANFTVAAVQQLGYDGAWFDSYSPSPVKNGAGAGGEKVSIWNRRTGRPFTWEEAMTAQQARLQRVWTDVIAKLGKKPIIWANNFENWFTRTERSGEVAPGDRELMIAAPNFRPFDGASLESWSAVGNKASPTCFAQSGDVAKKVPLSFWPESEWVRRTNSMVDAAALGLKVAAMTMSAGCQSQLLTFLPTAVREQLDQLHYASYLLAVAHGGGTAAARAGPLVGTTAFFADASEGGSQPHGMSHAKVWQPYTWELGAPAISKPAGANVSSWRVGGGTPEVGVYVRYFAQGVVVVCPGDVSATAKTWLAGGPYEDRLSGEKGITEIKMAANSGRILLKQQEDH